MVLDTAVFREVMRLMGRIREHDYLSTDLHTSLFSKMVNVMLDCPERPADFKFNIEDTDSAYDSICLTSGGADSTIEWFLKDKPVGLYVDMGQPYAQKELYALHTLGIKHELINLAPYNFCQPASMWKHIVPGRNLLLLTAAAGMLRDEGIVYFSVIGGEGYDSKRGDKSKEFILLFMHWYKQVTGKSIYIKTMHDRTKGEWLAEFWRRGYPIDIIRRYTVTCFSEAQRNDSLNVQCGKCQACLRKYLSFASIGLDIGGDFESHPMDSEYVIKYKRVLPNALDQKDFSHYSKARCLEDLRAIKTAEEWLKQSV